MLQSHEAIAHAYRQSYREDVRDYQAWFADPAQSLDGAMDRAAKSLWPSPHTNRMVMFPHQCRLGRVRMAAAARALAGSKPAIQAARTFDELHGIVAKVIGSLGGIGDLTVYDVAQRIGSYLGLTPDLVYLHCGTREGAKALGIKGRRHTVAVSELPPGLQSLTPAELEDVLCIYADTLGRVNAGMRASQGEALRDCARPRGEPQC